MRFLVVDGGSTLVVIVALRQLNCGLSIIFINLYDLAI